MSSSASTLVACCFHRSIIASVRCITISRTRSMFSRLKSRFSATRVLCQSSPLMVTMLLPNVSMSSERYDISSLGQSSIAAHTSALSRNVVMGTNTLPRVTK